MVGECSLATSCLQALPSAGTALRGDFADGGGVYAFFNARLTSSTVSGNSTAGDAAGGGGVYARGDVTLSQSTVTNNRATFAASTGGGIWSNIMILIDSSIVAGNTAGGGMNDIRPGSGTFTVNSSLLGTGVTPGAGTGNLFEDNPLLGPLANNGGATETHALLSGSPAIDRGSPAVMAPSDQRGEPFLRLVNGRADIGAYERQSVADLVLAVDTFIDENDGDYSEGDLSLREAIGLANGSVGDDTITFAAALSGQAINLGGSELEITEAVTIDAMALAANVTIDANELSRIFNVTAPTGDFQFNGLTLTGGRTTGDNANIFDNTFSGGALRSLTTGNLTLDRSTITGSSTEGVIARGGGVFAQGNVTLTNSTVSGNSTAGDFANGGGVFAFGKITLTGSTVSGNSIAGSSAVGGGVSASGDVTLSQSTVTNNEATSTGGGIWNSNDTILFDGSIVAGNTAGGGNE